jgi:hypothetical protein
VEDAVGIAPEQPVPVPDPASESWIKAVNKIMIDNDISEAAANVALANLLADHETRGAMWTTAVNEIIERDGVTEAEANTNLTNLLANLGQ